MTTENKLIAEFMGLETPNGIYFEHLTKDGKRSKLTHFILLEYHLSWDWLMPVVEKIDDIVDVNGNRINRVHNAVFTFDRNQVYNAVVEFINEYNKNKIK